MDQQSQQHYLPHHLMHTSNRSDERYELQHQQSRQTENITQARNRPNSTINRRQQQQLPHQLQTPTIRSTLGGKDLIIRMLAEVFQVNQDEDGQVRWQQVSSSLVPVSLYSRTTSNWLDYLLAASSAAATVNDPTNTMSPDSRNFLLLLQQFHQQTRPPLRPQLQHQQQQDLIVFQIVGHDFIDGHCKRILNVKLMQPGTRLGRASDYFVYWREPASISSSYQHHKNAHLQQQFSSSFTSSYTFMPPTNLQQLGLGLSPDHRGHAHTWGLNFASINDAKLFYDICSLNIVDLDFNSEYLKQLLRSDQQPHQMYTNQADVVAFSSTGSMVDQHRMLQPERQQQRFSRDRLLLQQQQQLSMQQNQLHRRKQKVSKFPHSTTSTAVKRQSSALKCPSCQQTVKTQKFSCGQSNENMEISGSCPIHGEANTMRLRSRSTTRQLSRTNYESDQEFAKRRARSFSTPASPDNGNMCPMHGRYHKFRDELDVANEIHHPQCLSNSQNRQNINSNQANINDRRPLKPIRGLMRTNTIDKQGIYYNSEVKVPSHNLSRVQSSGENSKQQMKNFVTTRTPCDQMFLNDRHLLNQRFNAEIMARNVETFDSIAHKDARLARARYANSRNMKEFLSLDAGGAQSSPALRAMFQTKTKQSMDSHQTQPLTSVTKTNTTKCSLVTGSDTEMKSQLLDKNKPPPVPTRQKQRLSRDESLIKPIGKIGITLDQQSGRPVCSVSTTTDDLPLDAQTKKRMLKLTSEEAISERTEPKSSTASVLEGQTCQDHHLEKLIISSKNQQQIDREKRAVSLEPMANSKLRGKEVRSDTGRRRSLERSMCVDLESSSFPASSFKKFARLSPLPSSSPMVPESSRSSTGAHSDGAQTVPSTGDILVAGDTNVCHQMKNLYHYDDHGEAGVVPTRDVITTTSKLYRVKDRNFNDQLHVDDGQPQVGCYGRNRQQFHRLTTFKSTPDMSKLTAPDDPMPNGLEAYGNGSVLLGVDALEASTLRAQGFSHGDCYQQRFINAMSPVANVETTATTLAATTTTAMPKRNSTLSSYAVPLCSSDQGRAAIQHSRQYHSCPSSLRRRRRRPTSNTQILDEFNHLQTVRCGTSHLASNECVCQRCLWVQASQKLVSHSPNVCQNDELNLGRTQACDHLCDCSRAQASSFSSGPFAHNHVECIGCNSNYNGASTFCSNRQHHHQLLSRRCQHDRFCTTDHFVPGEPVMSDNYGEKFRQQRPTSSGHYPDTIQCRDQYCRSKGGASSNRSPLNYGLYESDCEDEQGAHEYYLMNNRLPEDHIQDRGNLDPLEKVSLHQYHPHEHQQQRYTHNSQVHTIKPFQGYDQTMARTSLKSRIRSRSQPPGRRDEDVGQGDAFYLSKSLDNVKKLIQEVQHELDALKRFPLGLALIDMRDAKSNLNSVHAKEVASSGVGTLVGSLQGKQSVKMSLEENTNGAGRQLSDITNNLCRVNSTSATRRAGQFKCVGAIRKAGFLSVKKWILRRRQTIELARKQGWKRYWVCLRGTALLFHSVIDKSDVDLNKSEQIDLLSWIRVNCNNQTQLLTNLLQSENQQDDVPQEMFLKNIAQFYIEREAKHLIIIDGAIAQPIPEHPRRDFVFCLSTTFGDAYLFQASCQLELDNWISAIHNACAASIARELTRDEAIKLFETKIKHLELEAEKKLFLRQRLESRLTSMSTLSKITSTASDTDDEPGRAGEVNSTRNQERITLRSLLQRLGQQLLTLDTFTERLHCEIYQLSCYSSSCNAQGIFYNNNTQRTATSASSGCGQSSRHISIASDLPHPKTLLMYVSKPTKVLLIKLGVFTVSSFHAYIHARQESAETIVHKLQQQTSQQPNYGTSHLELRIRSHSISENLLSKTENAKLETDTEELMEMTNLTCVCTHLSKTLYYKLRAQNVCILADDMPDVEESASSDDRYSIVQSRELVMVNLKLNSSSTSSSLVKQVLNIVNSKLNEFEYLDYYLKLKLDNKNELCSTYVAKRNDTVKNFPDFEYAELLEKVVYHVDLVRSRLDEEAASPFGLSIEGQLLVGESDTILNVYCSYIEWGSAADKAGIKDEDELLIINGVAVVDSDMMFIESVIQDSNKLKLVVRTSREVAPLNSKEADKSRRDMDGGGGGKDNDDSRHDEDDNGDHHPGRQHNFNLALGSQIISDEHITTLVCPPPPAKSAAFLRTDSNLLRQKSDLGHVVEQKDDTGAILMSTDSEDRAAQGGAQIVVPKSRSQFALIDLTLNNVDALESNNSEPFNEKQSFAGKLSGSINSDDLMNQLLSKSERLTKMIGRDRIGLKVSHEHEINGEIITVQEQLLQEDEKTKINEKTDQHLVERLKKSILELIETEYAYIRHLETIIEHYMVPLEKTNYLNISDLRLLNQSLVELAKFQHLFLNQLSANIFKRCNFTKMLKYNEIECDNLNKIVQHLESIETMIQLRPSLEAVTESFVNEAESFKRYAAYCVAYSRLQRILHPKGSSGSNLPISPITLIPSSLNVFSSSLVSSIGGLSQSRDSMRALSSFFYDTNSQLKQMSDFLAGLDSSSSSLSLSSPKSSELDRDDSSFKSTSHKSISRTGIHQTDCGAPASSTNLFKSVHQQNFESYLIKPIQRIVKYPMLLNCISSAAALVYQEEPFFKDLQYAIKQMESVISFVNDTQRVHDDYGIVFEHIERQYFDQQTNDASKGNLTTPLLGPHQPLISLHIDQLLYFGSIEWLNINEFRPKLKKGCNYTQVLFVFKSCVVFICKEQVRSSKRKLTHVSGANSSLTAIHTQSGQGLATTMDSSNHRTFSKLHNSSLGDSSEVIRYQTLIPVSEVQVRSVPLDNKSKEISRHSATTKLLITTSSSEKFQWELFQCSSSNSNSSLLTKSSSKRNQGGKIYLLASKTNEERSTFLRKIRLIIRDSVRNMSLPAARSPSIKSLTYKKLSTSSSTDSNTDTNSSCSQATTSLTPDSNAVSGRIQQAAIGDSGDGGQALRKAIHTIEEANYNSNFDKETEQTSTKSNNNESNIKCENGKVAKKKLMMMIM